MSKAKKEFTPRLRYYHIILLAIFLCPLLILNSNNVNSKKQQEIQVQKEQKFIENLYLRRLDFNSDTNEVCKKGSKDLQEYYANGDTEKIGIKEGKIKNEKKEDYIDALINLVAGEGDSSSNIKTYAMHLIPVLVFFVIAILSLPGWLVCCICSCCKCCCCCCCKKSCCKLPFYIVAITLYAAVLGICAYGLSQSNSIFVGFADTECTILKLINEFIEGETKETTPKWPGMTGIKSLFTDTEEEIDKLSSSTLNDLNTQKVNLNGKKSAFVTDLATQTDKIYTHTFNFNDLSAGNGNYKLDIANLFGKITNSNPIEYTQNTLADWWYNEYIETANKAEGYMEQVSYNYGQLESNKESAKQSLKDIVKSIEDIETTLNNVKDQISGAIFDYGNMIEEYGKLGFKVVFSVLMVIDIAIAAFMTLLVFFNLSCSKCCCCFRCLFKSLIHILWNILALLAFLTLLLGSFFSLIGTAGKDLVSVVSYLVSDDNLNKENPILLDGEAKQYLQECINNEGNIKKIIEENGNQLSGTENIDQLKLAIKQIDDAKAEADDLLRKEYAYNKYAEQYNKVVNYQTDDINLIKDDGSSSFNFRQNLENLNQLTTNEKWKISCGNSAHDCDSPRGDDTSNYCIEPSSCDTNTVLSWYSGTSDNSLKDYAKILDHFIASIKWAKDEASAATSIYNSLNSLKSNYEDFLTEETRVLTIYRNSISSLTQIFNKFSGEEGDAFSIINCKFIGKNVKVILKYLENSLGKSFYTVGICLITSGLSLLVSISFTILLNSILSSNAGK